MSSAAREADPQAGLTLWRCCWPEVKRLSAELVKIDAYWTTSGLHPPRLAVVVWNGRRKAS